MIGGRDLRCAAAYWPDVRRARQACIADRIPDPGSRIPDPGSRVPSPESRAETLIDFPPVGGSPAPGVRVLLALLLAVACLGYVVNLGNASIWDANEAYYVETPREMIESGDYINPSFNYEPRVNKPVLSYWVVAGLYHLFGVSVGVQRIAIAAAALVMIGAMFFL